MIVTGKLDSGAKVMVTLELSDRSFVEALARDAEEQSGHGAQWQRDRYIALAHVLWGILELMPLPGEATAPST